MSETGDAESVAFFQDVLLRNGIKEKIKDISIIVPAELHGEHYASICEYVSICLETGEEFDFFTKKWTTNPGYTAMLKEMNMFAKEAGMFNSVLKDIQEFYARRTKSNKKELDFIPKCYFANDERIVMENLNKKGYFLVSKIEKQDLETAKMVIKNMAQLHAISYAMLKTEFGDDEAPFLSKYPCLNEAFLIKGSPTPLSEAFFRPCIDNCIQYLENAGEIEGKEFALEILSKYDHLKIFDEMSSSVDRSDGSHIFLVVNHGDCWSSNLLFHRDPTTNAIDHHIFVDFQVCRLGSPNLDLCYYFYTSVKPEVRRKHFQDLVKFYFQSLKGFVEDLDVPFEWEFEAFWKDLKRRTANGFWVHLYMLTAHEVIAAFDIEGEGDMHEDMKKGIQTFLAKNPEKVTKQAMEIVAVMKEHFGERT